MADVVERKSSPHRAPPCAATLTIEELNALDDEALRVFLQPGEAGVDPVQLGIALHGPGNDRLAIRILRALPLDAAGGFIDARAGPPDDKRVAQARRRVVGRLFWALLYWNHPDEYDELVSGETIHPALIKRLELSGRVIADLGCGSGRFTLAAAPLAKSVIAIDEVPALLRRLKTHLEEKSISNVELRRGAFDALPLADASVDVAVACSSLTSQAPFGGEVALREAARVVRPDGLVAVIWPDEPAWFVERGFTYFAAPGEMSVHFPSVEAARRLCRRFYSKEAERWVVEHESADVPYEVLGTNPPRDVCLMRIASQAGVNTS